MPQRRPHCTSCGYDRSGIPSDAPCPECGSDRQEAREEHELSAGSSRAVIALGLGTLSWIGLVGFGVIAVMLGLGAIAVSVSALHRLKREDGHDWKPAATAIAGLMLGISGAVLGVLVAVAIIAAVI